MPFSKSEAAELSEEDLLALEHASKRIRKSLKKGNRTFAQEILEPNDADSPEKVRDAIRSGFSEWTIEFIADARDGNYYQFS